jgi:3-(3-hydroxy-phenyl)propionate hydroxylase
MLPHNNWEIVEGMEAERAFDVVIAGFGPVGAVAACWLGQAGVRTLVVEKSRTIWEIPRAMALDHEILRVFQNIGVIDDVMPYTAPFGDSEHYGAAGQLIRRIGVVAPPYPLGYLPNMVFTQPPVERILRERAEAHGPVTVELGKEVTGAEQRGRGVSVTIRDEAGGVERVEARYVIGCDGASSTIRRLMKIGLDDLGFDEPWLVVDLMVHDAALAKLPSVCAQYCDPARPYTYIIGPGNHRRWEIMLNAGEDPREVEKEEKVWALLSRWLTPGDGRLWRASSYRFHALVADRWGDGSVFLAGDAAHQQPPFIGQGMCQGIRDVTNLCWKMTAVLRGEAADSLLDTYEQERSQHVRTLTQRIKEIGAAICERDPEAARLRDERLLKQGGGKAPVVTRQEIVPPLASGLIAPEHGPAAGTIFPQPRIQSGEETMLLDEIAGQGWRVFRDGRIDVERLRVEGYGFEAFALGGAYSADAEGVAANWFDRYHCKAAIVRPDHYVYCTLSDIGLVEDVCRAIRDRLRNAERGDSPTN